MVDKHKVLIILPAYNEGKVIGTVIDLIKSEGYSNILVIDDKSSDNTVKEVISKNVFLKVHSINKGAGAATRSGLDYARKINKFDFVVLMDSDGQHDPKDISKLLDFSKDYDVVIGSRMIDNNNMPFFRKFANKFGSFITWLFFGLYVTDSQSGFKVFNKKAYSNIKITYDRYEFCSEIIGQIKKKNLTFKEIPIKVIYNDHSMNKGHGQGLFNGFKMIWRFMFGPKKK